MGSKALFPVSASYMTHSTMQCIEGNKSDKMSRKLKLLSSLDNAKEFEDDVYFTANIEKVWTK